MKRALKKRYGRAKKQSDKTFWLTSEWRWVSGKEYINKQTGVWAKEVRPGVGKRIHAKGVR